MVEPGPSKTDVIKSNIEAALTTWLKKIPVISLYAETRGWFYLISWSHRITGILLVISLWAYLYSFHALQASQKSFILVLLLWMLAIPNGLSWVQWGQADSL